MHKAVGFSKTMSQHHLPHLLACEPPAVKISQYQASTRYLYDHLSEVGRL